MPKEEWNPFEEIARMRGEMDNMARRLFESSKPLIGHGARALQKFAGVRSAVSNIHETEKSVIASFEIPGVDKKDIELNVSETSIEVRVESKAEKEVKKKGDYSYESSSRSFYRLLPLPAEVIPGKTEASYKNGVLRVEMPKARPTKKEKGKKVIVK